MTGFLIIALIIVTSIGAFFISCFIGSVIRINKQNEEIKNLQDILADYEETK